MFEIIDDLTHAGIQFAVPLWLAGLGELVVERAGVLNISIEGAMLGGALAGWAAAAATGSPWIGLAAAGGTGIALAALLALVALVFDADQVVAGTAINLLAIGATGVGFKMCREAGLTQKPAAFFGEIVLFERPNVFNQFGLCHATVGLALCLYGVLRGTRFGVELIALGEYPPAAAAAGLRVRARRAGCLLFGGLTAGLAGSYLSIMNTHQFVDNMTAGRGFLALAMVIFGRWHPGGLLAGGLFFGYVYALANYLGVRADARTLPPALLHMAPYVLSLLVLAGLMGRTRAPAALGRPLER
ncbi:MAG: ABC transporter permease [Phycisphaerae bacterium]